VKEKIKFIRELAQSMNENKIEEVQYEENNFEIQLRKKGKEKRTVIYGGAPVNVQPEASNQVSSEAVIDNISTVAEKVETTAEISGTKIESPMVGTFYIAPSPTSAPFIKEGDIVKGKLFIQYVCESLKVDSELRAVQPFPKSPHIEAVVRVVKHINSYSLLVESAISDSEILVEFENDVAYEKDDVIFFEGELSFEFL